MNLSGCRRVFCQALTSMKTIKVLNSRGLIESLREVCKTFIHRFDSDPRLHPKLNNLSTLASSFGACSGFHSRTNPDKKRPFQDACQAFCQACGIFLSGFLCAAEPLQITMIARVS